MKILAMVALLCILAMGGSATAAASFNASFKWCPSIWQSPSFAISGVPKNTAKLKFQMWDHNASFNHGGGEVEYHGQKAIPCDAFSGWTYPQPPSGTHTYEFSIKALDSSGAELGSAIAIRDFPDR